MTIGELIKIVNELGSIKDIINDYSLIEKIINFEDKDLVYVFARMLNHSLNTKDVLPSELENLRDGRLIISLIQNNVKDTLIDKIKYLCEIQDADVQISLFKNPVVINSIADQEISLSCLNNIYLDTRIAIVEELLKMRYVDKALEITSMINIIMACERDYLEERDFKPLFRW